MADLGMVPSVDLRPTAASLDRLVRAAGAPGQRLRRFEWDGNKVKAGRFADDISDLTAAEGLVCEPAGWTPAAFVVAVDGDSPESLQVAIEAAALESETHGTPSLVASSGTPGHAHLYFIASSWEEVPRLAALGSRVGSLRSGQLVRLPGTPSAKPGAGPSRVHLVSPDFLDRVEAISRHLGRAKPPELRVVDTALTPAPRAETYMMKLLEDGFDGRTPRTAAGRIDGSHVTAQIAWRAAEAGIPLERLLCLLADEAHRGGITYRKRTSRRGEAKTEEWVDGMMKSARRKLRTNPPNEAAAADAARSALDRALRTLVSTSMRVDQARLKVVCIAVLLRMLRSGRVVLAIGDRNGALISGLAAEGYRAFEKVRKRAYKRGWLTEVVPYRPPAHAIVLGVGAKSWTAAADAYPNGPLDWPLFAEVLAHDAATGLTDFDRLVLGYLCASAHAVTVTQIAASVGLTTTRATTDVGESLRRLRALGLLIVDHGTWSAPADPMTALDNAARTLGVVGQVARVRAKHEQERVARSDALADEPQSLSGTDSDELAATA